MMGGRMSSETPAERAARLRDVLQLRPNQDAALQAFVGAQDSARQSIAGAMAGPWPQTTPERLTRMQQMMSQHQTAMSAYMDATRRFYDQLDPAQKRAFDAMGPRMMMPGGGMGGGMGGGGWGGHGGMRGRGMMAPPPPPAQ
jgi:hypothetical protein